MAEAVYASMKAGYSFKGKVGIYGLPLPKAAPVPGTDTLIPVTKPYFARAETGTVLINPYHPHEEIKAKCAGLVSDLKASPGKGDPGMLAWAERGVKEADDPLKMTETSVAEGMEALHLNQNMAGFQRKTEKVRSDKAKAAQNCEFPTGLASLL